MESEQQLINKILRKRISKKLSRENKGVAGVDKKDLEATRLYLKEEGHSIINCISQGKYKPPHAIRRVEIPKPNGGMRKLGIPTLTNRVIQQAIVQILTPILH